MKKVTTKPVVKKQATTKKAVAKKKEESKLKLKTQITSSKSDKQKMVRVAIKDVKKAPPKDLLAEDSDFRVVAEFIALSDGFVGTEEVAKQCHISLDRAIHCCYWLAQAKLIAKYRKGARNYFKSFKKLERKLAA